MSIVEQVFKYSTADRRLLMDLFPQMVKHDTDIMMGGGEHNDHQAD